NVPEIKTGKLFWSVFETLLWSMTMARRKLKMFDCGSAVTDTSARNAPGPPVLLAMNSNWLRPAMKCDVTGGKTCICVKFVEAPLPRLNPREAPFNLTSMRLLSTATEILITPEAGLKPVKSNDVV